MLARHLAALPPVRLRPPLGACDARVAAGPVARLRGLAGLGPDGCAEAALLLPATRSVHTFGMRLALDLVWLDGAGRIVRIDRAVPPGRVRGCRVAHAVLELPAGRHELAALSPGSPLLARPA